MILLLFIFIFDDYSELSNNCSMIRDLYLINGCILFTLNVVFLLGVIEYPVTPSGFSFGIVLIAIFYIAISGVECDWVFVKWLETCLISINLHVFVFSKQLIKCFVFGHRMMTFLIFLITLSLIDDISCFLIVIAKPKV